MTRHLAIVSTAFTWGAVLLGLPSLSGLLYFLWALLSSRLPAAAADGQADYNSLVGLLMAGAQAAGKALRWLVNGAQVAMVALAVIFTILLASAIALWAIGRGLHAHQTWARVLGILIASALLLASLSGALFVRHGFAVAASSAVAFSSMYTLWALWRQFN